MYECLPDFRTAGISELRQLIADVSGIPLDRVEYMKTAGSSFMRYNTSVLKLHSELGWDSEPSFSDKEPLNYSRNGDMYYYR